VRLTRVYIEQPLAPGKRCIVQDSAANHLARVLRLRAGDTLTVFDGSGDEYAARVEAVQKKSVVVEVGEHRAVNRESPIHLSLAQGVSRGERMDLVVQKATELGVARIVPVLTQRSVVRLDARQTANKLLHWRAIAIAACEQSGRNRIPEVAAPVALDEFLRASASTSARVLLSPEGTHRVRDLARYSALTVLIGPEGGLTEAEHEAASKSGFTRVSLGPRILRTETAALAALAVLQHHLGDL
jgi:16S rRNA (uracil1498-N3)-methyltransferase